MALAFLGVFSVAKAGAESVDFGSGACDNGYVGLNENEQLPENAQWVAGMGGISVYVDNVSPGVSSVWWVDKGTDTVKKVCVTNPEAPAQWSRMTELTSNAVEVPIDDVASAQQVWICPGDGHKIIVQGCPDARNEWTYLIDVDTLRAWQFPSQEGVVSIDDKDGEIILASYGYDEDGRYSFDRAYSADGKFIRMVGDKEREEW